MRSYVCASNIQLLPCYEPEAPDFNSEHRTPQSGDEKNLYPNFYFTIHLSLHNPPYTIISQALYCLLCIPIEIYVSWLRFSLLTTVHY